MLTLREKIMLALSEKKECSRRELAEICRVAPSQVSRIIKKMIKDGNVEKNRRYFCSTYNITIPFNTLKHMQLL